MTFFAVILQGQPVTNIDLSSVVSVAILVVLIGAAMKLSSQLTELRMELQALKILTSDLSPRLRHVENHLMLFEEDVNNLFAVVRANPYGEKALEITKKSRFRPLEAEK